MATKNGEGKVQVKSLDEIDFSNGQPAEFDLDASSNPDEIVYEGGPLDGQRGEDAAVDEDLAAKIEKRREEQRAQEALKTEQAPTEEKPVETPKEEVLPELELDESTGETKVAEGEKKAEETPAYTPTLTYKVYDQEKTFPEWAQKLITSKETEDEVRSLFSKADALPEMQEKQRRVVEERDQYRSTVDEHVQRVNDLVALRDKSLPLFFQRVGLNDQQVLQYARQRLEALSDESGNAERAWQAGVQNQQLMMEQAQFQQQQSRTSDQAFRSLHEQAMNTTFAAPDVKTFEERFDAAAGKPGAFKAAFLAEGDMIHKTERGRYAPPQEVAQRVMQRYQANIGLPAVSHQQPAPTAPAPVPAAAAPAPAAPARTVKPIPRVGGLGVNASPTKQRIKSLDEVAARVKSELG